MMNSDLFILKCLNQRKKSQIILQNSYYDFDEIIHEKQKLNTFKQGQTIFE